jgi:PBP1b-binding outer membrane lipoprotein LpoB
MNTLKITALALALTGCARVPATKVSFNPATGELKVSSPKDIELTGLHAYVTNGLTRIDVEKYTSKNNVEVIKAVSDLNAENAKKGAELLGTIIEASK